MSEQIDKYLSKATENNSTDKGSNFEILKDVLKSVPSPELVQEIIENIEDNAYHHLIPSLRYQREQSERIYKKFAHILRRK